MVSLSDISQSHGHQNYLILTQHITGCGDCMNLAEEKSFQLWDFYLLAKFIAFHRQLFIKVLNQNYIILIKIRN